MKLSETFKNKRNFLYLNRPIRQDWWWDYYVETKSKFIYLNPQESGITSGISYTYFINNILKNFLKDYE